MKGKKGCYSIKNRAQKVTKTKPKYNKGSRKWVIGWQKAILQKIEEASNMANLTCNF